MIDTYNLCPLCHSGHKQTGKTTFTVDLKYCVVVVRDVPAQVCDLCGADWLDDATAEQLEKIVDQARHNHANADRIDYWQNFLHPPKRVVAHSIEN